MVLSKNVQVVYMIGTHKISTSKVKVVLVARRKEKLAEVKVSSLHLRIHRLVKCTFHYYYCQQSLTYLVKVIM